MRELRLTPLLAPLALGPASAAETPPAVALPPLVVSATRTPQDVATLPLTVDVVSTETLHTSPAHALDDALRGSAAFSLFRRSGSLTANPTAQGVSLRGIGPSGASRALVLLDGIPVNDPFGGWIAWTKLPAGTLDRIEIVRGGGSAAWGGSSLGGVVHLISSPLLSSAAGATLTGTLGDFHTRGGELSATVADASGNNAFRVGAATFATDGVKLVRAPGPIDTAADLETSRGEIAWSRRIDETTTLTASLRAWREDRGNGTPYQQNGSEELFASATLSGAPHGSALEAWRFTIYAQDQDYRSTFSSVNAARDAETPASDQYSVPATAAGFSAQFTFGEASADPPHGTTTVGFDARFVEGETREHFSHDAVANDFLRERRAGGRQTVAGLFATHARALAENLTLTTGARLDATWRTGGFRRETIRATGAKELDERYRDHDDPAFSPSLGLAWRIHESTTARAAAYSAHRTPTLNELHRPFRVGAVTTQANPDLEPETLLGGELGLAFAAPDGRLGLRATVFQNTLSDAVANVTIGANLRERRNLDSARIRGLELGAHWSPAALSSLRLEADYLLSDTRVRSGGPGASDLDGKRLAQVPRHTVTAGAIWRATPGLAVDLRARWFSAQFEDDLNTLTLASATRIDLAAHYALTPKLRLTVAVENLFDEDIETGRSAAGVVNIAPPRLARVELRYTW